MSKVKKTTNKQMELPLSGKKDKETAAAPPATHLMKKVASLAPNAKSMKKVFSDEEIAEILDKRDAGEGLLPEEKVAIKDKYRKIKRQVKEMEKGNQSRVIVFPSLPSGDGWYKVIEFSALYYAYRLADRMGRSARVYKDSDKFSKAIYSATFQNIEKFVDQFEWLESPKLEITADGIYIFTLQKPVSDDEVGALRRTEETRREKLHNILRPRAMDPATYQAILMIIRQVAPRVRKLEKQYYYTTGEGMVKDIQELMAVYFDFANGIYDRKEAGIELLKIVNRLLAGLTVLAETRVWPYDICAVIGENIAEIKRLVEKDFNVRIKE
ncbi:hypothetical protein IJF93_00690 [Candidatus Saccharibacteria bacterium]|nr:hypothetical protein [Candidatus Saccharibacteria bacterium]